MLCYKCRNEIPVVGIPGRFDECPHCRAEMHCCLNCRFYDPYKPNQCMEPEADYVADKDRANFCEFFQPNTLTSSVRPCLLSGEDARRAFDKLFGE